jgi:hypothetical protein
MSTTTYREYKMASTTNRSYRFRLYSWPEIAGMSPEEWCGADDDDEFTEDEKAEIRKVAAARKRRAR